MAIDYRKRPLLIISCFQVFKEVGASMKVSHAFTSLPGNLQYRATSLIRNRFQVFKEAGASASEPPGGASRPELSESTSEKHFEAGGYLGVKREPLEPPVVTPNPQPPTPKPQTPNPHPLNPKLLNPGPSTLIQPSKSETRTPKS